MNMTVTLADLTPIQNPEDTASFVRVRLGGIDTSFDLIKFMYRYAYWNGYFGSGVATLSGKIGRSRGLFIDRTYAIPELADRSVLVASHFFDAARDEFDDRDTPHRDTHRDLAQALVAALIEHSGQPLDVIRPRSLHHPIWLEAIGEQVAVGYGNATPDTAAAIFRAMGYHLGSEVLADQEFTVIDQWFRTYRADERKHLIDTKVEIAGQFHNAYAWIHIHSGGGSAVEADHFEWAVKGANLALDLMEPSMREAMKTQILVGYRTFAHHHRDFFDHVLTSP